MVICCRYTRVESGLQISRWLQSAILQSRQRGLEEEGIIGDDKKGEIWIVVEIELIELDNGLGVIYMEKKQNQC